MKNFIISTLIALSMFAACAVEPDAESGAAEETASLVDGISGEGDAVGKLGIPAEFAVASVAPGCSAASNCSGTKTCGAWSEYFTCGAQFQGCRIQCGLPGRGNACYPTAITPQNRTRSCVMRASGQTCVEVDYRAYQPPCAPNE